MTRSGLSNLNKESSTHMVKITGMEAKVMTSSMAQMLMI